MADDDDDDAEGEGGGEEQSGGGGGKKKLFIIIGVAVFVLLGAGAGLFFTGLLDPLLGKKQERAEAKPAEPEPAKGAPPPPSTGPVAFFDMPEMIVTLNTSTKAKAAFMKLRLSLEVPQSSEIPKVQAAMPRIVDNLQGYLRELRPEELKGSAGAYRLKEEMLTRINLAVAPARVNAVLFKELQVQ